MSFDDPGHVPANPHVVAGLDPDSIVWAFTTFATHNWHPLTWLSHMLDCALFGVDPGAHHLVNVGLHLLDTLLLFAALRSMTGSLWRSGGVAALFALHPLHVESVAWISERKDVLSALFWMLALLAYSAYARAPTPRRYALVALAFGAGLLAKPMLVTLPCVLFLLDFWPLRRFGKAGPGIGRLVLEKLPLLALSAASSAVTLMAQHSGESVVGSSELFPLTTRICNALASCGAYLRQTVWPAKMAILYPYPESAPVGRALVSGAVLLAVTGLVVAQRRSRPHLLVGWLWFLGTLVPVLGLVQVGVQARADRYTYLPLIGLFVMIAWTAAEVFDRFARARLVLGVSFAAGVIALGATGRVQLGHWRDSYSLYGHALRVTSGNYVARYNLGCAYLDDGRLDEAIEQFRLSVRNGRRYLKAEINLANAHLLRGDYASAIERFGVVLDQYPDHYDVLVGRGTALVRLGRLEAARADFLRAARVAPGAWQPRHNLALLLQQRGDPVGAVEQWGLALRADPNAVPALLSLADLLSRTPLDRVRNPGEALRLAERAAALAERDDPEVLDVLAGAWAAAGRFDRAEEIAARAGELAVAAGRQKLAERIERCLDGYRAGRPCRYAERGR